MVVNIIRKLKYFLTPVYSVNALITDRAQYQFLLYTLDIVFNYIMPFLIVTRHCKNMILVKKLKVCIVQDTINIAKLHFSYQGYPSEQRGMPF